MPASVHDPALGLRLTFSHDSGALIVAVEAEPGGGVPDHFHPQAAECWTVIEGEVEFRLARSGVRLVPGETIVVAPNARHGFRSAGAKPALLRAEITPSGRMQAFIEEAAALSRAGKVTSNGRPAGPSALLALATFAARYFDTTVRCAPPPALQRALFPLLARLARPAG